MLKNTSVSTPGTGLSIREVSIFGEKQQNTTNMVEEKAGYTKVVDNPQYINNNHIAAMIPVRAHPLRQQVECAVRSVPEDMGRENG
jgi:hypothetical protein